MRSTCPTCEAPLREGARFCVACGLEVRPPCPACNAHTLWLPQIEPNTSAWCANRGTVLYYCENCGRWLLPNTRTCPNPDCAGRVLPYHPQHTGRRWDGRGSAVGWIWPPRWESHHPQRAYPQVAAWSSDAPVHAALVAHDGIYLWAGSNFLMADPGGWTTLTSGVDPLTLPASAIAWRYPLGPAVQPSLRVPFEDRLAAIGPAAILAGERGFTLVGLAQNLGQVRLDIGTPLAQVGGPNWWVGWSEREGVPTLHTAPLGVTWDTLQPTPVETPEAARIAKNGRLFLQDGLACWPGQDGSIWQLTCETRQVAPIVVHGEGLEALWMERNGPRAVWVAPQSSRITVGLSMPVEGRIPLEIPGGTGPLRGVYASHGQVAIVGERIFVLDAPTGDRLYEANRPPGRWIAGALAGAPDNNPRLLALTQEREEARLYALLLTSGRLEEVWVGLGFEALALLPVQNRLTIAHSRGLVRLTET